MRFFIWVMLIVSGAAHAYDGSSKVDFDISMGKQNKPTYEFMFRHPESEDYYHTFKRIYDNNFYKKHDNKLQIPKIIHQLWVGKPLPKFFESYIETCKKMHPSWDYKLWTEKDLQTLPYNKDVVDKLKNRLDVTKDYFMHIILEKFGGVFMDVDYVCFKPLDQLNYQYDAWFALEPSGWWKKIPTVSYSIVAAKPEHPIIKKTVKDIEKYAVSRKFRIAHNQEYNDKDVKKDLIFASVQILEAINIAQYCKNKACNDIMVFPPTYFLPTINISWMMDNIKKYSLIEKIKMHLGITNHAVIYDEIKPETIAMNDFNAKDKINPFYYKEKYSKS